MQGCLICGSRAETGRIFCPECDKFALVLERKCRKCGAFTLDTSKPDCFSCNRKEIHFEKLFSYYIYSGSVSQVISIMKYGKIQSIAEIIGKFLSTNIPDEFLKGRTVVFPPMTFLDKFKRSFNQAEIIADRIAFENGLVLDSNLLKKIKKTKPQASLTYIERQKNLKKAFSIKRKVTNEDFLIVDDVCTTFSTINTISELLKRNGAKSVYAVTFARTSPYFS